VETCADSDRYRRISHRPLCACLKERAHRAHCRSHPNSKRKNAPAPWRETDAVRNIGPSGICHDWGYAPSGHDDFRKPTPSCFVQRTHAAGQGTLSKLRVKWAVASAVFEILRGTKKNLCGNLGSQVEIKEITGHFVTCSQHLRVLQYL
jgi:hypothetical protein